MKKTYITPASEKLMVRVASSVLTVSPLVYDDDVTKNPAVTGGAGGSDNTNPDYSDGYVKSQTWGNEW